jgi:CRP-like cAMP-binding protein
MLTAINGLRDIRSQPLALAPGQHLFRLGDPISTLYVVKTGRIHLIRHPPNGSALILQQSGAGSVVAEASIYAEKYHCDAIPSVATQVIAISKADFLHRLRSDPDFADAWQRQLAHELQKARLHAEILSIKTVAKRLDAWIAERGGETPRKGDWKLIAHEIGATPEAFYREMARRRQDGHAEYLVHKS